MTTPTRAQRVATVRNARARAAADGSFAMPRRLRTPRLVLAEPGPQHETMVRSFFADERTATFLGGVLDAEEAWRKLAAYCGQWQLNGFGHYIIEHDDTPVGFVGLWFPDDWPEIELGYGLTADAQGRGIMQEATGAVIAAAWQAGIPSLVSYISPRNLPSQRTARRAGAVQEGSIVLRDTMVLVFRYPQPAGTAVAA